MRRALLVLAGLSIAAAARGALADVPAPAPPAESCPPFRRLPAPRPGFYPARDRELWVDLSFIADYDVDTGKSFPALGLGIEYDFVFDRDARFRLGPRAGVQFGRWGDDQHHRVSFDPGLRFRWSFYMDPIVDVFVVTKVDALLALGSTVQAGLRPGIGPGVRLGRAVQIEGSFDFMLPLGAAFERTSGPTIWSPGLWMSGAFDLCTLGSFCNRPEPQQVVEDDTGKLYDEAHAVCVQTKDAAPRRALCAAVDQALDGDRYPPAPDQDSTEAFLRGVQAELDKAGEKPLAKVIDGMAAHHHDMEHCRRKNQLTSRLAAQSGQQLEVHYNYAPFPVLLRRALGCDTAHLPPAGTDAVCPDVWERPAASRR